MYEVNFQSDNFNYLVTNENCMDCLFDIIKDNEHRDIVIVTDPPYNIGYKYNSYHDKLNEQEYYDMLSDICWGGEIPIVLLHYAEQLHKFSIKLNKSPDKVVSWVYNTNLAKQHRQIAFYGVKPNFSQVRIPYKDMKDKRNIARIERYKKQGKEHMIGAKLYDWWNVTQVKNTSKEKLDHPCQIPLEVMKNIIGILPKGTLVIDPFAGTGTTLIACLEMGYDCILIEQDEKYYELIKKRIDKYNNQMTLF